MAGLFDDTNGRVTPIFFDLHHSCTDEEIRGMLIVGRAFNNAHDIGCLASISGWDFDPRPLYLIPEAVALSRRLLQNGFLSCLHITTLLDESFQGEENVPYGAFEFWCVAKNKFNENKLVGDPYDVFQEFMLELPLINEAGDQFIGGSESKQ